MLKEIGCVEIISLVDNSIDFLSTIGRNDVGNVVTWVRKCMGKNWFKKYFRYPIAEHGFSAIIKVLTDNVKYNTIMFDTGISSNGVLYNVQGMDIDLKEIEAIILSHVHYDHFGDLLNTVKAIDKEGCR